MPVRLRFRERNPDWTLHFLSDAIEKISGYPSSDFVGNDGRTYNSIIHPDDRDMVDRAVEKALESREPFKIEYRIRDAHGNARWVHESGKGIRGTDGELMYLDGAIFDITERKKADEALRQSGLSRMSYLDLIAEEDINYILNRQKTILSCEGASSNDWFRLKNRSTKES